MTPEDQVKLLISLLNEKDIEFFTLHYYQGYSYQQIAEFYDHAKQSVKDRIDKIHRIMDKHNIPIPQHHKATLSIKKISVDPSKIEYIIPSRKHG